MVVCDCSAQHRCIISSSIANTSSVNNATHMDMYVRRRAKLSLTTGKGGRAGDRGPTEDQDCSGR